MSELVCTQRLLPQGSYRTPEYERALQRGLEGGPSFLVLPKDKLWPWHTELHVRFLGGTSEQHARVQEWIAPWAELINLSFTFDDAPDAQIRISFVEGKGSWSYVGTDALSIPPEGATMNFGWLDEGVVLHEFGHAIGAGHEHQSPREGIDWNEEVVVAKLAGWPNYWDRATVEQNIFSRYAVTQTHASTYDVDSIMHYFFPTSWVKSGPEPRRNIRLSPKDRNFVRTIYPRDDVPAPVELTVNREVVHRARLAANEKHEFSFRAEEAGRYVIETEGGTDTFLNLNHPDGSYIAKGDDQYEGKDLNARIVQDLEPGTYLVTVRHYKAEGVGDYTLKVTMRAN